MCAFCASLRQSERSNRAARLVVPDKSQTAESEQTCIILIFEKSNHLQPLAHATTCCHLLQPLVIQPLADWQFGSKWLLGQVAATACLPKQPLAAATCSHLQRLAATCSHFPKQPLAATSSHLQPLAQAATCSHLQPQPPAAFLKIKLRPSRAHNAKLVCWVSLLPRGMFTRLLG